MRLCELQAAMPRGRLHRHRLRRPRDTARSDDGGLLRGRRAPLQPRALSWEPGERPEWHRSARWHVDVSVSVSVGFERHEHAYPHTVDNTPGLARFAAHHRPFYERLYSQRLDVTPWEHTESS